MENTELIPANEVAYLRTALAVLVLRAQGQVRITLPEFIAASEFALKAEEVINDKGEGVMQITASEEVQI